MNSYPSSDGVGGLFFDFEPFRSASTRRWRRVDGAWRHLYAIAANQNTDPRESKPHDA